MKNLKSLLMLGVMTIFVAWFPNSNAAQAQTGARVSFQLFYDQLSPYGEWVRDREYGYMWIPDVHQDFHPYASDGYWVHTNYGNTWVSDYDWGWAPFHYGRWTYDNYYGWAWIPDYEWGPAWVNWRSGNGYYGWAPLGPSIRVSINIPVNHWVFIPQRHIFHRHVHRHRVHHRNATNIYQNTIIINNTYVNNNRTYYTGPNARDIERATRSKVRVHQIQNSNRPGKYAVSSRSVQVYRPEVDHSTRSSARPQRVADVSEVRSNNRGTVSSSRGTVSSSRGSASNDRGTVSPSNRGTVSSNRGEASNNRGTVSSSRGSATENRERVRSERPTQTATPQRAVERNVPKTNERTSRSSTSSSRGERSNPAPVARNTQPTQRATPQRATPPKQEGSTERTNTKNSNNRVERSKQSSRQSGN